MITDGPLTMDRVVQDLECLMTFGGETFPLKVYPSLDSVSGAAPPALQAVERIRTLRDCRQAGPLIMATSIQALMQKTVSPGWVAERILILRRGNEQDPGPLLPWLEESGYAFESEVLAAGQASWRGGILDVWPPSDEAPLRIEFFGTLVESIRRFDPVEQRSREMLEHAEILPATERESGDNPSHTLLDHLPEGIVWVWVDRERIDGHAELLATSSRETGTLDRIVDPETLTGRSRDLHLHLSFSPAPEDYPWSFDLQPMPGLPATPGAGLPLDRVEEQRSRFIEELTGKAASGWMTAVFFSSTGTHERFVERYGGAVGNLKGFHLHDGLLSESFHCTGARTLLVSDLDLYGIRRDQPSRHDRSLRRKRTREVSGERIQSWTDIQPGDYVVHVEHGIGIYRGLFDIEVSGRKQEALTIEYAEGARIHIPVGQTHLLSRYIGVGKRRPELHTLGGRRWLKEKASAERAVEDMAALLIETQAARDARPGHAFSKDTTWQHEFEDTFPFEETPDQARAILEVKADMESSRPMDRLICGDVGYGKTEVAMRASFKAVMDGKQVAILVPTTVLAQQHHDTFTERMAAFPVRIESLSRFRTRGEQEDILERLAAGSVDIIIGTHRLVQKDVRFRDLGLVIIDEEQRFGVKHKEHLKQLRQLVDVLTMTATPIPRTLYMSLTGAKDLSIIETAPVERLPIETIVTEQRDDIIREAILRELNREGQVYFLHNRVGTIASLHIRLAALVPEARIRVAHGQMNEHELSEVMRAFNRAEFDVLLCTTIIESGLNIPNVNTIIIDRADRFGLAELYQLRGRVGRFKRKAFAYLLLPRHGRLFFSARQRIGAIKRHASLGSGFKLAMRDLELRGAGNILGAAQSGHIAAVGFDLYCQLLQRTVARLKGESPDPLIDVDLTIDFISLSPDRHHEPDAAVIPITYIEDETLRVRLYRRLASITREAQLNDIEAELRDRFGPLPEPAARLLMLSRIRLAGSARRIDRIEVSGEKVMLTRDRDFIMTGGKFPRLPSGSASEQLSALLDMVSALPVKPLRPPPSI